MASPLESLWIRLAGPADQGPVTFATLQRRDRRNDALAASPGAIAGIPDLALPVYAEPPDALLGRLDTMLVGDADVERVDDRSDPFYRRYVARTTLLRFPDTVDVEAIQAPGGGSLLRLYSRSLLGKGDLGANRKRLAAWTEKLAAA